MGDRVGWNPYFLGSFEDENPYKSVIGNTAAAWSCTAIKNHKIQLNKNPYCNKLYSLHTDCDPIFSWNTATTRLQTSLHEYPVYFRNTTKHSIISSDVLKEPYFDKLTSHYLLVVCFTIFAYVMPATIRVTCDVEGYLHRPKLTTCQKPWSQGVKGQVINFCSF